MLAELLAAAGANVEKQMEAVRREAAAGQAEAAAARRQLADQADKFRLGSEWLGDGRTGWLRWDACCMLASTLNHNCRAEPSLR